MSGIFILDAPNLYSFISQMLYSGSTSPSWTYQGIFKSRIDRDTYLKIIYAIIIGCLYPDQLREIEALFEEGNDSYIPNNLFNLSNYMIPYSVNDSKINILKENINSNIRNKIFNPVSRSVRNSNELKAFDLYTLDHQKIKLVLDITIADIEKIIENFNTAQETGSGSSGGKKRRRKTKKRKMKKSRRKSKNGKRKRRSRRRS